MNKAVKTSLITVSGLVALGAIGAGVFVMTQTYTVQGKVTDLASKQPIEKVRVTIGSHEGLSNKDGSYSVNGIKIYERKAMTVEPPAEYEQIEPASIDYASRSVSKDVSLEPTLETMVNSIEVATKNHQFDYLWDFMHPDDKTYWGTKEEYTNLLKQRDDILGRLEQYQIKSSTIGKNIRTIPTWKHEVTGKKYTNITEVPIDYVVVSSGKENPQTVLNHYQKADGYYHYFTSSDKTKIKEAIDSYNNLQKSLSE
jgi:hypothetical protein